MGVGSVLEAQLETREVHGKAMGTSLHIVVTGDERELGSLIDRARHRVVQLEQRWSRFLPDSEISRCNELAGIPVDVSSDTRRLVNHAIFAWNETNCAYDPTVLDALVACGYDRPFDDLDRSDVVFDHDPQPAPGCAGIVVDDELQSVLLPPGVGFDPGGIGKGLAADLLVEELIDAGAAGALVNIGGDLRTAGRPALGDWTCEIAEVNVSNDPIATVALGDAGLATSTTRRRTWRQGGRERHHVIDPRVGEPVQTHAQLATVISGAAWWSEIVATQLLLSEPAEWDTVIRDSAGLVIDHDGNSHILGTMKDHLR